MVSGEIGLSSGSVYISPLFAFYDFHRAGLPLAVTGRSRWRGRAHP